MDIKLVQNVIRTFGLGLPGRILRSTLYRDFQNRIYKPRQGLAKNPGLIVHTRLVPSGAYFEYENANMEIIFLAPDLARITWQLNGTQVPLPVPYTLVKTNWPPVTDRWQVDLEEMTFTTRAMKVIVQNDGGLIFHDTDGKNLREELPPEFRGNSIMQRVLLEPDAHIYGLGERTTRLNHRSERSEGSMAGGYSYKMWNTDPGGAYTSGQDPIYLNIPVYIALHSQGSYLAYYENSFPATFTFETTAEVHFENGLLRYYIIIGSIQHLIERFTELSGRAPMPPRWVLGYQQCRWGYKTEADVRQVIAGFQLHDMPISAIHLDIDYMEGYRVFTVDRERFPDLKNLVSDLDASGIKTVSIVNPGIKKDRDFDLFKDGINHGLFIKTPNKKPLYGLVWPGWAAFPDFTDPKTRQWWGSLYPRLSNLGIAGFWHDMNEPTSFSAWGDPSLPLAAQHDFDGRKGQHDEAHNLYGYLMARSAYEALQKLHPARRPWIFSRSGWAGMQQYAWSWTGDTQTSWSSLRMTIPEIIGLGLSGVPFTGPDIGGFSAHPSAELYTRWFQMAAFLPLFRTHSPLSKPNREPWVYGEPTTTIVRNFIRLRYQLMPFLYTQVWDTCQTGHPFIRPVFWQDSNDSRLWDIDDSFMVGDSLLISPILEEGETKKRVFLPRGEWYNFWNTIDNEMDSLFSNGPVMLEIAAPLQRIPVLVRAGTMIPMDINGKLHLHFYLINTSDSPRLTHGVLYSDAGDGYGPYRLDQFNLNKTMEGIELDHIVDGDFPFPQNGLVIHLHGCTISHVWVDDQELFTDGNQFEVSAFQKARIAVNGTDTNHAR